MAAASSATPAAAAATTATQSSSSTLDPRRLRECGPWSEQLSSSGKRYYYNRETEVSQWAKPPEWIEAERRLAMEQEQNRQSPIEMDVVDDEEEERLEREREREMREREMREREMREKEMREREMRDREMREREMRARQQHQHQQQQHHQSNSHQQSSYHESSSSRRMGPSEEHHHQHRSPIMKAVPMESAQRRDMMQEEARDAEAERATPGARSQEAAREHAEERDHEEERGKREKRETEGEGGEEEEEEEPEWRRLYRPDLAEKFRKQMFGADADDRDSFRQMVLEAVEHHVISTEKMTEVHKARSLARTSLMKVSLLQKKAALLRDAQEQLEKDRLSCQASMGPAPSSHGFTSFVPTTSSAD